MLGYHLEQAARYRAELGVPSREVVARAVTHLAAAGARALERSDFHAAANLHDRATSLLEPDDPRRARLLPVLAEAVYGTGEFARSLAVMEEAVDLGERLGEAASVARARVFSAYVRVHMGQTTHAVVLGELDEIIPDLPPGDHDLLARAHMSRAWILSWLGRAGDATSEGMLALDHAEQAGSSALEDEAAGTVASAMRWGPAPWDEFERFVEERLAAGGGRLGSKLGAAMLNYRPAADAARGDFDLARERFAQRRQELIERGATAFVHRLAIDEAFLELAAGDPAAAARTLEVAWIGLEEVREHGFRSTIGALLAASLARLGRIEEAEKLIEESDRLAARDDVATEIGVARARAFIAAARASDDDAIALAEEAVRVADTTDYLEERAELHLHLGATLIAAQRFEAAAGALREAIALADRKGATVVADRARALLALHH